MYGGEGKGIDGGKWGMLDENVAESREAAEGKGTDARDVARIEGHSLQETQVRKCV